MIYSGQFILVSVNFILNFRARLETQANPHFQKIHFFAKINFFYILNRFDTLILKIIFLKKKHHFNIFQHEKHFKKQLETHYKIPSSLLKMEATMITSRTSHLLLCERERRKY
jgi:hypothetical protein